MPTKFAPAILLDATEAQEVALSQMPGLDVHIFRTDETVDPLDFDYSDVACVVGAPAIYAEDEAASADEDFIETVEHFQPRMFLLETVRGLSGPRFEDFLHDLVDDLADTGYAVGYEILEIGGRKRLVIIGRREDAPVFEAGPRGLAAEETITRLVDANLRRVA